jgi:hypothetical protein
MPCAALRAAISRVKRSISPRMRPSRCSLNFGGYLQISKSAPAAAFWIVTIALLHVGSGGAGMLAAVTHSV